MKANLNLLLLKLENHTVKIKFYKKYKDLSLVTLSYASRPCKTRFVKFIICLRAIELSLLTLLSEIGTFQIGFQCVD